jgi:hypothetical protein
MQSLGAKYCEIRKYDPAIWQFLYAFVLRAEKTYPVGENMLKLKLHPNQLNLKCSSFKAWIFSISKFL